MPLKHTVSPALTLISLIHSSSGYSPFHLFSTDEPVFMVCINRELADYCVFLASQHTSCFSVRRVFWNQLWIIVSLQYPISHTVLVLGDRWPFTGFVNNVVDLQWFPEAFVAFLSVQQDEGHRRATPLVQLVSTRGRPYLCRESGAVDGVFGPDVIPGSEVDLHVADL